MSCQAVTGHGFFGAHLSLWKPVDSVCKIYKEDEESSLCLWRECSGLAGTRLGPLASSATAEIENIYRFLNLDPIDGNQFRFITGIRFLTPNGQVFLLRRWSRAQHGCRKYPHG